MFGWASAPYDYDWSMRYPRRSAIMGLAGPMANFILLLLSALTIHVLYRMGLFIAPDSVNFSTLTAAASGKGFEVLATVLSIFCSLNLILTIFNLFPLPGFDGSALLWIFLSRSASIKVMNVMNSSYALLFLIVAWRLFDVIFDPIHLAFINAIYPDVTYE